MRKHNRIALAALFLLAGAAAGLRAATPENGVLKLPEIGKELAELAPRIELTAVLADGSGKQVPGVKARGMKWEKGAWSDEKGKPLLQLTFSLKDIKDPQDPALCYKLRYSVSYEPAAPQAKAEECLPIRNGEDFSATASFPLDLVYIDAGKLKFVNDHRRRGLAQVRWSVYRKNGGAKASATGILSAKKPQGAGTLAAKGEGLTAHITFLCFGKAQKKPIEWADNGKDLRKLPAGLRITLAQPDCGEEKDLPN